MTNDDDRRTAAGTWGEAVAPLIARFEVAAKFNADAVHNNEGAAAIAKLMQAMADKLDYALAVELLAAERRGMERAAGIVEGWHEALWCSHGYDQSKELAAAIRAEIKKE